MLVSNQSSGCGHTKLRSETGWVAFIVDVAVNMLTLADSTCAVEIQRTCPLYCLNSANEEFIRAPLCFVTYLDASHPHQWQCETLKMTGCRFCEKKRVTDDEAGKTQSAELRPNRVHSQSEMNLLKVFEHLSRLLCIDTSEMDTSTIIRFIQYNLIVSLLWSIWSNLHSYYHQLVEAESFHHLPMTFR